MILRPAFTIWLICILIPGVQFATTYTKDELANVDLEPKDRATGMLSKGWHQKLNIYDRNPNRPYDGNRLNRMSEISNEAQDVLDNMDKWNIINTSAPYYFDIPRKNQAYFRLVLDAMVTNAERVMIDPGENEKQRTRQCLAIANTMLNSRMDIQRYFKVRYLYTWTLHFEIGYLSQEILRHYTVVIDLFHLVVTRYEGHPFDDFTPARYMLYMYSVILQECKMIIKLCHMMHELEKKYKNFEDQTKLWRDTPGSAEQLKNKQENERALNAKALSDYNLELERARLEKMRALKRKQKKSLAAFKGSVGASGGKPKVGGSGFGASGVKGKRGSWKAADYFYGSVNASKQKKSSYPKIYGWSVENFPF